MNVLLRLRSHALIAGALTVALGAGTAHADTIVFDNALQAGSQQNYVLGMDFVVNSAVTVTQLGSFDSNGDGFRNTIDVGIFDLGGSLVGTSASLTGLVGTLINGSRFVPVVPFVLDPGTYSIVAAGYTTTGSGTDLSGNTGLGGITAFNSVGGALSLVPQGGRWDNGTTFALPTTNSGGYPQSDPVFQAGTFAVPDGGSTLMLLGLGTLALGWIRRRVR